MFFQITNQSCFLCFLYFGVLFVRTFWDKKQLFACAYFFIFLFLRSLEVALWVIIILYIVYNLDVLIVVNIKHSFDGDMTGKLDIKLI
jgi:hypothetical protein